MIVRLTLGLAMLASTPALAAHIDRRTDLPPCTREHPRTQDCHITGPEMAIDMMTRPPDRERQPNAYDEFKEHERQRERETHGRN